MNKSEIIETLRRLDWTVALAPPEFKISGIDLWITGPNLQRFTVCLDESAQTLAQKRIYPLSGVLYIKDTFGGEAVVLK